MTSDLSAFNTNPACQGVGPTRPVEDPYRTAQLVVFSIASVVVIASSAFLLWRRGNRKRLKHRSLTPLLFGSLICTGMLMVRSYYDYVGREFFSCTTHMVLYYMLLPMAITADSLAFVRYLQSMSERKGISGDSLKAFAEKNKTSTEPLGAANVKTWLIGFRNYLAFIGQLYFPFLDFSKAVIAEEKFRHVSKARLASYEIVAACFMMIPFLIACIVRVRTEPSLMIENHCTGCGVMWVDWVIVLVLFQLYFLPFVNFIVRHRNVPDALMYKTDATYAAVIMCVILVGSILTWADPGDVMRSQKFDWFTFEMVSVLALHYIRVMLQLHRTFRIQRMAGQAISLIHVLSDRKASLLFEKHLMAELASENLLFWREAIKYKLSYDRQPDFDYTQQLARVLYRTFIGRHAQLPINISGDLAKKIEGRFRGQTVGRNVFDEAIVEVYRLLEGSFSRFVHSQVFREYAKTTADFSMATTLFNPNSNAVAPYVGDDAEHRNVGFDIEDYVRSL